MNSNEKLVNNKIVKIRKSTIVILANFSFDKFWTIQILDV
jgi:hypothetical protein